MKPSKSIWYMKQAIKQSSKCKQASKKKKQASKKAETSKRKKEVKKKREGRKGHILMSHVTSTFLLYAISPDLACSQNHCIVLQ